MSDEKSATQPANEAPRDVEVIELVAAPAEPPPPPPPRHHAEAPSPFSTRSDLPPRNSPPVVLGDLMSRQLIAVNEDEPIGDLEASMDRFRFHHLLVVREGKLVGLITRTDYLHALLGVRPDGQPLAEKVDAKTKAGTVMRRGIITGKMGTPILTACRVLLQEKLGCIPIVLDDGTLVGIVTESDFARLAVTVLDKRVS